MATSSTALRTWRVGDRLRHHIVDPRTGDVAEPVWRAVTVVAATAELANAAATTGVVLGRDAPYWLAHRSLPARLNLSCGLTQRPPSSEGTALAHHNRRGAKPNPFDNRPGIIKECRCAGRGGVKNHESGHPGRFHKLCRATDRVEINQARAARDQNQVS